MEYAAKRSSGKSLRWGGLAVLLLGVAGGLYYWQLHHAKPARVALSRAVPVVAGAVAAKDVPVYFNGIGTVQASNTVTIHSRVDGQLTEIDFKEGQDVHKGDLLAKLDSRTYQAQLDQANAQMAKDQATLVDAKLDLQRYVNLGNRVTGQQVDTQRATVAQLEASIKSDQAAIENAQTMLSYCTIASPIDGRTGFRQVDPGNIVHSADANGLVVVAQLQPISVIFTLPQQDLVEINRQIARQGALKAQAQSSDGATALDEGTLVLVDNQISQSTGTITLKATFPNQQRLLWPGGFVNVRLLVRTDSNVPTVPDVAVQHGPDGAYVFAIDDDDKVHIAPVTVALVEGDDAVLSAGLKPGDRLVVDGMSRLDEGTEVAPTSGPGANAKPSGRPEGQRPNARRRAATP